MAFEVGDIVQCVDARPGLYAPYDMTAGQKAEVVKVDGGYISLGGVAAPWWRNAKRFRLISRPSPDPIELEAEEPQPALARGEA